ncbi:hypothetical protein YC2023_006642 [Brassica napus]
MEYEENNWCRIMERLITLNQPGQSIIYVIGLPGELYQTKPYNQWGYYSSATRNFIKHLSTCMQNLHYQINK